MKSKMNWSLITAIVLPLVMMGIVALSLYIPSRSQAFNGRFVYALNDTWYGGNFYAVVNGKLKLTWTPPINPVPGQVYPSTSTVHLYLHDLSTDRSESLTFEQASELVLNFVPSSPDGLQIVQGSHGDSGLFPFFFFGSSTDYSSVYVMGKRTSKRLSVTVQEPGRYRQFHFIGWVKS